jgi:hypothetical protein
MSAPTILTTPDLEALLFKLDKENAGQGIRMESRTIARGRKTSSVTGESKWEVFGSENIWKISSQNYKIGQDYENVVNIRRDREGVEGEFKSQGTYGNMEARTILRMKDGSFQMRVFVEGTDKSKNRWVRDDGTELSPELVARLKAEFLPPRKDESPKQGIEKTVKPRNFAVDSILSFRAAGVDYIMARPR